MSSDAADLRFASHRLPLPFCSVLPGRTGNKRLSTMLKLGIIEADWQRGVGRRLRDPFPKLGTAGDRQFLAVSIARDPERCGDTLDFSTPGHMQARAVVPHRRTGHPIDDGAALGDVIDLPARAEPMASGRAGLHSIHWLMPAAFTGAEGRQSLDVS